MSLDEELEKVDTLDPVDVGGIYNLTLFNKASGPRLHLTGSYFEQSLILNEAESPRMYTGFERQLGMYNDSLRIAKANYVILHRIEKFPTRPGYHYTLVVRDINTGIIGIIENKHYESLAEEHGYFKPTIPVDMKQPGDTIHINEVTSKSASHDKFLNYRFGKNVNVAYISKKDNIEDGYIISDEFAENTSYASIKTVDVTLGFNDVLLNIYGDKNHYRSFPDIFQEVKNGIFCAKRSIDSMNAGCNTTAESLSNIDTNDELFHGDGVVMDVEIFINSNQELMKDNAHRQQIIEYYNIIKSYKYNVYKCLEIYIKDRTVNVTTEVNSRYHNYKDYIDSCDSPTNEIRFSNSTGTFEFAYIKFTIGRSVKLSVGSKLTNRFGGKGVVCAIVPAALMPVDSRGVRADVILNPIGTIGRSNSGQHYEHELNFIADHVLEQIKLADGIAKRFKILHDFFILVDKENADAIEVYYKTLTNPKKHEFLDNIIKNGIYVRQHPFNNIDMEGIKKLYIKFGVKPYYVTTGVRVRTKTGYEVRYYKSKNPVIIASEYLMVLKHTTESKFSSISVSDVNTLGLPHKNTARAKNQPFKSTPIKFGEINQVSVCGNANIKFL